MIDIIKIHVIDVILGPNNKAVRGHKLILVFSRNHPWKIIYFSEKKFISFSILITRWPKIKNFAKNVIFRKIFLIIESSILLKKCLYHWDTLVLESKNDWVEFFSLLEIDTIVVWVAYIMAKKHNWETLGRLPVMR